MTAPSLSRLMGHLVADTAHAAIPDQVRLRARVSLLHNLTVGLAGRSRDPVAHRMVRRFWAHPAEATLLHDGTPASIEGAAIANAALFHARSQDDTHAASTSHPGSPTMAAALAIGEAGGHGGAEVLDAIVLGYEVLGRIGRAFDEGITARGFRAAAVLGGFGAAAVAARLLRLSAEQTAHALGFAANLAGGLAQVWREGSAEGPLQLGFAARNGISAARAAAAGATAACAALDGPAGFFHAYADTDDAPAEALRGIGHTWQLTEVTVKPYPVCAILQGPVGCMLALDVTGAPEEVALTLNPYEAAYPGIDHPGPFASAIATKMSAQFSLALALVTGRVNAEGLARIDDPAVLAMARRVRVVADPAIAPRQCRLMLRMDDGRTLSGSVEARVGQPSFDEAANFARALAPEMGASAGAVDRLVAAVAELEHAPNLGALFSAALGCGR